MKTPSLWATSLRILLHLLCATPAVVLIYKTFIGGLGFNPIETVTHQTGIWALRILLVSLAITPLRILLNLIQLVTYRRLLGVWAFFYAFMHFSIYLTFDLQFSFSLVLDDIIQRPFITAGFSALLLMIPLAMTSTRGWQRRLKKNWGKLHKAIYVIGIAAVMHFFWLTRGNQPEPYIYAGLLILFYSVRLVNKFRSRTA
jgi:sulfoxide reductase heme-binding subunit YedZ|tara:strand:+ start:22740 stop:23339 length:600 start_codon:yes stop_codon:yes gene_type:complete